LEEISIEEVVKVATLTHATLEVAQVRVVEVVLHLKSH
jgi:hypothetical protein